VPDPDWGERIVAYVVSKPGADISEDDVKNYVGEKLASYKKPKEVYFVDELPYTPSGKLLKRVSGSSTREVPKVTIYQRSIFFAKILFMISVVPPTMD